MIGAGNIVKIRFRRFFSGQPLWIFVGKVLEFTDNWIKIEGKGAGVFPGHAQPAASPIDIDKEYRALIIPRDNIAHIRVLPKDFDMENIVIERRGLRFYIKLQNETDVSFGEIGEVV